MKHLATLRVFGLRTWVLALIADWCMQHVDPRLKKAFEDLIPEAANRAIYAHPIGHKGCMHRREEEDA